MRATRTQSGDPPVAAWLYRSLARSSRPPDLNTAPHASFRDGFLAAGHRLPRAIICIADSWGREIAVDLSTAIAKLMRHRTWGAASLHFIGDNDVELLRETRETIEIGERLFRKAIMDAKDAHQTKN